MSYVGGCFVVVSGDGLLWDGEGWVRDWQDAKQFAGLGDPWADCKALADEVRTHLGVRCAVAYIPRTKITVFDVPSLVGGEAGGSTPG